MLARIRPADLGRFRPGVSIQSKLLVMLLSVSLLSAAVIGYVGFVNGRDSLRQAAVEQLTTVRELKASALEFSVASNQVSVRMDSRTSDAREASNAFNAAFEELRTQKLAPNLAADLDSYYENTFIPELEETSGIDYEPESLLPNTEAGRYLQSVYSTKVTNFDEALEINDAGDGSAWSAAHALHHDYFKRLIVEHGYEDMLLLNTKGEVVYSAYKGVDLGVSILAPPYADSQLADAYRDVMRTNTVDAMITTDYQAYMPSLNAPTTWNISPVGASGEITGVMAVQVPIGAMNSVMSGNGKWAEEGLGETGESYVVGDDKKLRSESRILAEHPETYAEMAISGGTPPLVAKRIVEVDSPILLQEVATTQVEAALLGQTGVSISHDYLGRETLTAYGPVDIDGPRWVIVASIETSEAFAPVAVFTRTIALSVAGLVLLIALLSMLLARSFTRPLGSLMTGVKRVATGERDVHVDVNTKDEFAQLAIAFNDMSGALQVKADLLDDQLAENDRLLLTLMPEKVAQRYRQGDSTIAEDHQDVTVVYADIVGFDELNDRLGPQESLMVLNNIFASFDEAAERLGVERVRTTKQGYLASCGLLTPRVDSTRRAVEFCREAEAVLRRLRSQHGYQLSVRAGIDTGRVTSGLVGTSSVVYDMWGDAVSLAYQLQGVRHDSGVFLTQRAADKLPDDSLLAESGSVQGSQGELTYWRLTSEDSNV